MSKIFLPLKTAVILFLLSGIIVSANAQNIEGAWNGKLQVFGSSLRIVFHIKADGTGYSSTMDSPDQGAYGIPVEETIFRNDSILIELRSINGNYKGKVNFKEELISGVFSQNGMEFKMDLGREPLEKQEIIRPQNPEKTYPYHAEEVTFENKEQGVTLAGTLTFPEEGDNFTAVILITGSGPQNRDEEIVGHKPFLVIADHLTRNGIAVLRYDDRGTAQSTGTFAGSTSADFAKDALAAFNYLKTRKEINPEKIGFIGHSEGGLIAPMVASQNKEVAFIVMLAGPGVDGGEVLLLQQELMGRAMNEPEDILKDTKNLNTIIYKTMRKSKSLSDVEGDLKTALQDYLYANESQLMSDGMSVEEFIQNQIDAYNEPWMYHFIITDPADFISKVNCPVLALNGEKDLQVDADQNLTAIEKALDEGNSGSYTLRKLRGLNHLFQEAKTGSPMEYGEIEQTISPQVLEIMEKWINKQ